MAAFFICTGIFVAILIAVVSNNSTTRDDSEPIPPPQKIIIRERRPINRNYFIEQRNHRYDKRIERHKRDQYPL